MHLDARIGEKDRIDDGEYGDEGRGGGADRHVSVDDGTPKWSDNNRVIFPEAFVRNLRYYMDGCAGTNNSQFCFGSLALQVSLGILDVINIAFMVVGHTKFDPDLVARALPGALNRSDTHNPAMLQQCAQSFTSAQFYNGDVFSTTKRVVRSSSSQ